MTRPVWLEVALNGPWGRDLQPMIPITADEIVADAIACADQGAAILHLHAYDPGTGRQRDAYELYAPIFERIRAARDLICYPTLPLAGGPDAADPMTPDARFEAVRRLAEAGLIDWTVIDPGSTNITRLGDIPEGAEGFVYTNPDAHIRHGLDLARTYAITPSYAIYEPGFLRLGAALHAATPGAPMPIYRFMFSDQLSFGFPPEPWALDAYLALRDRTAPGAPWMAAGLGVDIAPLIAPAVARGGHVRTGLEDARFGCPEGNATLTAHTLRAISAAGGRPAPASEVRAALARWQSPPQTPT